MNNIYQEKVLNWVTPIIYILIGLAFICIPSNVLIDIIFTVLGLIIIFLNLVPCIYYFMMGSKDSRYYPYAVMALISVIIGFVFIFQHNAVLAIILGIWLVVLPIVRIILSNDRKHELVKAIPYFVAAILLFFIPAEAILDIVLKVFGGCLIALGLIAIVYNIIISNKHNNKNNNIDNNNNNQSNDREIIDVEYKEL